MTSEKFVVAYEGSVEDSSLLSYALERAKKEGATLHIVHVLEWSPYSFLTPEELEERHGRRKDEISRAREVILEPAIAEIEKAGVTCTGEIRYGQVVEIIAEIAGAQKAAMIFVGRSGRNSVSSRVFGSVPLGLAQIAPVPTVIVP